MLNVSRWPIGYSPPAHSVRVHSTGVGLAGHLLHQRRAGPPLDHRLRVPGLPVSRGFQAHLQRGTVLYTDFFGTSWKAKGIFYYMKKVF